ncbi:MAG: DEAD/DEAH box helicase [Desulfobulbaceae bacterium]|nr:MAG: DEAD/DEAH box helicase [Desulfobulbaceae bacterium]
MGKSQGFNRLHKGVQRWVWKQKWTTLRDIQERAIEPILSADCDLVISASTAAGKTEAAFLPACSRIAELAVDNSIGILYISPLKALINDQYRRLESLCEILNIPVTPWHGDVSQSIKDKQRKNPHGILLITPESLESLFLNQSSWCSRAFDGLSHIVIDEFHAFLGTERGCQLQSLMHRLEFLLDRTVPRIALSATLDNMQQVAQSLRPNGVIPCEIIESTASPSDLKVQLRGYLARASGEEPPVFGLVADDLYAILRGMSHLVFANSRGRTEELAAALSDRCKQNGVPNEFFPHHGSLSKEIRESLEARLQEERFPTTAVCTMTLELGIDIGSVDSIAQVTAPHSVASLRQRLGRSGRRDKAAVLRLFITENEITAKSHLLDRLRLETVQCIAMINLLLAKKYESPPAGQYHFSTLVQQTLSVIGQYGGVRADQLWSLLCDTGPFSLVDRQLFVEFLRALGGQELISQTNDGQLILGHKGENLVGHFTFYTAFNTPEEYRLECDGRILGTVPFDSPLMIGQLIIFAGRRWQVLQVDSEKKLIILKRAAGGEPPSFGGRGLMIDDRVRQEMLRVYRQRNTPIYLDKEAKSIFSEGIDNFHILGLDKTDTLQSGNTLYVFPWCGDRAANTITALLRGAGLTANNDGGIIEVRNCSINHFHRTTGVILNGPKPTHFELANEVQDTIVEKHDPLLSKEIRNLGYGARFFDVDGAWKLLSHFYNQ